MSTANCIRLTRIDGELIAPAAEGVELSEALAAFSELTGLLQEGHAALAAIARQLPAETAAPFMAESQSERIQRLATLSERAAVLARELVPAGGLGLHVETPDRPVRSEAAPCAVPR